MQRNVKKLIFFFSFKKLNNDKLEACAGDILVQSGGDVELALP